MRKVNKIYHIVLLCVLAVVVLFRPPVPPALACTPTATPAGFKDVENAVYQSQIIVEGTITAAREYDLQSQSPFDVGAAEATIQVKRYFKGSGGANVDIRGFGESTACFIEATIGIHGIFYAISDTQGVLWLYRADKVDTNSTLRIIRTTGQVPLEPYTSSTTGPSTSASYLPFVWFGIATVLLVLVMVIFSIVWLAKRGKR
jgi:hypothetical protein